MENNTERRRYVFISYSSKEFDVASKVCLYLEKNGISCWIAPRNVDAGGDWIEASNDIDSAMIQLKDTVVSLSDNFSHCCITSVGGNERYNPVSGRMNNTYEQEEETTYDRDSIVELIIEKTKKYPYNIYSKISTEEKYNKFIINAVSLFKEQTD